MSWALALNIGAALLMGVLIGLERQWRQHPAGLRTNTLVALGSALYVALSTLVDHDGSPTRVAAQVVSGLGFLGGGVILREGLNVRGLNTAATIWCSGAVGALAGAGFPLAALMGTFVVRGRLASDARDLHADTHRQLDRLLLTRVLEHTAGNVQQAALLLGIARQTLRLKLRELGLALKRSVETDEDEPVSDS